MHQDRLGERGADGRMAMTMTAVAVMVDVYVIDAGTVRARGLQYLTSSFEKPHVRVAGVLGRVGITERAQSLINRLEVKRD
jgi:hypothetical protein